MILTKSGTVLKGVPNQFTLDIDELAALVTDPAKAYYADTAHWYKVTVFYLNTSGTQSEKITFNPSHDPCIKNFLVSAFALESFLVDKIVITDFDNGKHTIPRVDLPTEEFDVIFIDPFFVQPLGVDTYSIVDNKITKATGIDAYDSTIRSYDEFTSGVIRVINNSITGSERIMVGLGKDPRTTGSYADIEYAFNNGDVGYGIYENGSSVHNTGVVPVKGDLLEITLIAGEVKYYINGVLRYTSLVAATGTYYLTTSLYDVGSSLDQCYIGD